MTRFIALYRGVLPEPRRHRQGAGFTLIELMITVAIIGILAAIAYPAYTSSVIKGKRSEGRAALADLMQQQERYMTQTGCYGVQVSGGGCAIFTSTTPNVPFKTFSGNALASSAYTLGVRQCTSATTFALRDCAEVYATPTFVDNKADRLWIRSTGEKGCDGTDPSVCWK